jgi:hypothetical protein
VIGVMPSPSVRELLPLGDRILIEVSASWMMLGVLCSACCVCVAARTAAAWRCSRRLFRCYATARSRTQRSRQPAAC